MENSRTAVTARFMDICLADVLDFFGLDELLLSAMLVSRCWREQALDHPTYWRRIFLQQCKDIAPDRGSQSIDLFLLRLSRTFHRPIEIYINWKDIEIIVPHVIQHLSHIRELVLYVPLSSASALLDALRLTAAPLLEWLSLHFQLIHGFVISETGTIDIPSLPHDIFSSHAPRLKTVFLENIELLPGSGFPFCLLQITSLGFNIHITADFVPFDRRRMLNISQYFPNLRTLEVGGDVVLDDPVFWNATTWSRLDRACFSGRLWDGRSFSALPIAGIRRVQMRCSYATDVVDMPNTLIGPISLAIPYRIPPFPEDASISGVGVTICMSTATDSSSRRERWINTVIMRPDSNPISPQAMTAFQLEIFVERVERLDIFLEDWDRLVGAGFLVRLPTLRTLVLLLEAGHRRPSWNMPTETSVLSSPCLTQLVLKKAWQGRRQPRVQVAEVAAFARQALPDARFPLILERDEVALDGAWEDFPQIFSDSVVSAGRVRMLLAMGV